MARARHQLRDEPAPEYLYQSPERLEERALDHRSDLFALGAVLFEALAGRAIFDLDDDGNRCLSKKRGRSLGEEGRLLRPVLRRMLSTKVDQRYPSSGAVIEALEEVLIERSAFVSGTPVDEWLQQVTGADNLAALDFDDADSLVRMPDGRVKGGRPHDFPEASLPSMAHLKRAREAADALARADGHGVRQRIGLVGVHLGGWSGGHGRAIASFAAEHHRAGGHGRGGGRVRGRRVDPVPAAR